LRLESLDIDHPAEARAELEALAEQLRSGGWSVEVADPGEPTLSRFRESAEGAFVDVLNLVLDEAERHALDIVLAAIFAWAVDRVRFRGREGARPVVVIYLGDEDVREEPLPEPRTRSQMGELESFSVDVADLNDWQLAVYNEILERGPLTMRKSSQQRHYLPERSGRCLQNLSRLA
jgi:hypothetical protein